MRTCPTWNLRRCFDMNYDENWGIALARIDDFFSSQSGVERTGVRSFLFGEAKIELEELPEKRMGSLRMARTRVKISGGSDADEIYHRFFIRFLSAGG